MSTTNSSILLPSREIVQVEADRAIEVGRIELLGRQPWSTGTSSGIIESNQEKSTVKCGPGIY
jgi:hypothetical protein